ncbi:hypothetical protein [Streptomyces sp. NPDC053755]|uniref:hypothetical protein n=1 Tax=Streptomyces sp. NPDC053755 TaxID=3155815 RepID=UPI00343BD3E2
MSERNTGEVATLTVLEQDRALLLRAAGGVEPPASLPVVDDRGRVIGVYTLSPGDSTDDFPPLGSLKMGHDRNDESAL